MFEKAEIEIYELDLTVDTIDVSSGNDDPEKNWTDGETIG